MITPEVKDSHTKAYDPEENSLITKGNCQLNADGSLDANVTLESSGVQYGRRYGWSYLTKEKQIERYKDYWDYIDNVTIESIHLNNDRKDIKLTENIEFNASSYGSFLDNNMIIPINMLNRISHVPDKYKDRKRKLKINRGFSDIDECMINLPEGYSVSSIPEPIHFETGFGTYSASLEIVSENTIKYHRKLKLSEGLFPKEDYKKFRSFMKKVSRYDNLKIILIKK
jgi:hypothetical protein